MNLTTPPLSFRVNGKKFQNGAMAGLQCHDIKNKNRDHSINEIKKLGYER